MRNHRRNQGFTLWETMAAAAVCAVLLAVGFLSVGAYQKTMRLAQMDETAEAIFLAAQNQMAYLGLTGEWQTLREEQEKAYFGSVMEKKPGDYPEEQDWETGRYCWIRHQGEKNDGENNVLEVLLPFGSVEEDIRTAGTYVVEYDYRYGEIYGVFYTEDGDLDYYQDILEGLDQNGGRIPDREGNTYRKNYRGKNGSRIIGYYGGAVSGKKELETLEEPEIQIHNGDLLMITIRDHNYHKLIGEQTVRSLTSLRIYGEVSAASAEILLDPGNPEDWWSYQDQGTARIYRLVLDKPGPLEGRFTHRFPELIPGENLLLEVRVNSSNVPALPAEIRAYTNSLFSSVTDGTDGQEARISCVRHLQNLSSEYSGVNRTEGQKITKAVQLEDLDWEDFRNHLENQEEITGFSGIFNEVLREYDGAGKKLLHFPFQPDGQGNAGLFSRLSGEARQHLTVRDLTIAGGVSEGVNAAGLLGKGEAGSQLEAQNILLEDFTVTARGGDGGTLAGDLDRGILENCQAYLTDGEAYQNGGFCIREQKMGIQYRVYADQGSSGGLIGSGKDLQVRESFAAVPVSAGENGSAGGMAGSLKAGGSSLFVNCFTGGFTRQGDYPSVYGAAALGSLGAAGGFVGRDSGNTRTEKCYSTCSAYGTYAGSFTGIAELSVKQYEDCYSTGAVYSEETGKSQGRFFGETTVIPRMNRCYYLKQGQETETQESRVSGLEPADYEQLQAVSWYSWESAVTCSYDSRWKDCEYPFPLTKEIRPGEGIHYGDWPGKEEQSQEEELPGSEDRSIGLVYYEIVENALYYHGYLGSLGENGQPEYREIMTAGMESTGGLVREKNRFVSEDGYLVLIPRGTDRKDIAAAYGEEAPGGEFKTLEACTEVFVNSRGFQLEGYESYVLRFTYPGRGQKLFLGENLSPYYPVFGDTVSFRVTVQMGDSVRPGTEEETAVYRIRSARHLRQMKTLSWSHTEVTGVEYVQELDLRLSGMEFTENDVPVQYPYEKPDQILASYTAYENCGIWGMEGPMFGAVRTTAKIRGIRLYDSKSGENGSLAITNEGLLEDCMVEDSTGGLTVETQQGAASGFVGNNYGTIQNCGFSGRVLGQEAYGLCQINQGIIENFSIHALQPGPEGYEEIRIEAADKASGAVGENRGTLRQIGFTGTVRGTLCSGFVSDNQGSVEACYANGMIIAREEGSGFVRSSNGGSIRNCFSTGSVRGGLLAAGFGAGDSFNGVMENCYAALFGLEGEVVYRFARGGGQDYRECYWLENSYVSGNIQGEGENDWDVGEKGTTIAYQELKARSVTWTTYSYKSGHANTETEETVYPFPVWSVSSLKQPMDFWGDWPKEEMAAGMES